MTNKPKPPDCKNQRDHTARHFLDGIEVLCGHPVQAWRGRAAYAMDPNLVTCWACVQLLLERRVRVRSLKPKPNYFNGS